MVIVGDLGVTYFLSGLRAHTWQRISAYYLLMYIPFSVWYLSDRSFDRYELFQTHLLQPEFWVPTFIALGLVIVHSWVGLRDIVLDYLPRRFNVAGLILLGGGLFWISAELIYLALHLAR